jgi:WhiB family transcriptional regulator, redox-sensing transcriptional regulator
MPTRSIPISGTIASAPPFQADPTLACRTGVEPADSWFPEKKLGPAGRRALALCRSCPKVADCLAWALDTRQPFGILGATTAQQRALILQDRQMRRAGGLT